MINTIYNFFYLSIDKMASIKLEDLYLSKDELKDIMQLVVKKRNIKNYKN